MNAADFWQLSVNGAAAQTFAQNFFHNARRALRHTVTDVLSFTASGRAIDTAPLMSFGDAVAVTRNGKPFFAGMALPPRLVGQNNEENHLYTVVSPWYDLPRTFYQQEWTVWDGTCVNEGAITCAEIIQKAIRWAKDAVAYFDYTTSPPTLNVRQPANLPAVTKPLASSFNDSNGFPGFNAAPGGSQGGNHNGGTGAGRGQLWAGRGRPSRTTISSFAALLALLSRPPVWRAPIRRRFAVRPEDSRLRLSVCFARLLAMRETAISIVRRLRDAGHTAYFVGGCVRDMIRGVEPDDFDIATSARPEQVQALFPKTVSVGAQFGVVLVLEGKHQFEVATFRSDEAYLDGRRPSGVRFGSPEEDAHRRDFTINGLFYEPLTRSWDTQFPLQRRDKFGGGRIIDFVNGREDIERKLVRTIGDPRQRFAEDKLRLLRCVRFAANLGFEIEPSTFTALKAMAFQIGTVSAERIRDELIRIFTRPRADRGLELLDESGLLAHVLPEIAAMKGVEQPAEFHPEGDVFQHTKLMLNLVNEPGSQQASPPLDRTVLAFAVLLHDVGKPPTFERAPDRIRFNEHDRIGAEMAEAILRRLRFSNDQIEKIALCVREHMRFQFVKEMRPAKLKRILARATFPEELELHRIDCAGSHRNLENYEFLKARSAEMPPEVVKPERLVDGNDLLALGLKAGPTIGQILREIEEMQLEERLKSREEALEFARSRVAAGLPAADGPAPNGAGGAKT
jgi:poly(A) polymerase